MTDSQLPDIEEKYVLGFYDNFAKSFSNTRQSKWDWIENFLNKHKNGFYYDFGCGNGRNLTPNLSIGIDNCQSFVDEVNASGKHAILSDMASDTKLSTASADHLICIASLHHLITNERRLKALHEMRRVIKLGGILLLSVWSITQPENRKLEFNKYGDVYVDWKKNGLSYPRYYYIFHIDELTQLFKLTNWHIITHTWQEGNEVFELEAI